MFRNTGMIGALAGEGCRSRSNTHSPRKLPFLAPRGLLQIKDQEQALDQGCSSPNPHPHSVVRSLMVPGISGRGQ